MVVASSSSLKISAKPLMPNFETEYAPQKLLPLLATPDEVKISLGRDALSNITFNVFVRIKGARKFTFITSSQLDRS